MTLVLYYMKVLRMLFLTSQSAWARNDSILRLLHGAKAEASNDKSCEKCFYVVHNDFLPPASALVPYSSFKIESFLAQAL